MYDVFISYSTQDSVIVDGLSKLLGIDGRRVFRDRDNIKPGDDWKKTLTDALDSSEQIVLFWCCHTAVSSWVELEIDRAIYKRKRVIPVLMCHHPLPEKLARYQWIDLRYVALHVCVDDQKHTQISMLRPDWEASYQHDGSIEIPKAASASIRVRNRLLFFCGLLIVLCAVIRPFPNGLAGDHANSISIFSAIAGVLLSIWSLAPTSVHIARVPSGTEAYSYDLNSDRIRHRLPKSLAGELELMDNRNREAVLILYNAVANHD